MRTPGPRTASANCAPVHERHRAAVLPGSHARPDPEPLLQSRCRFVSTPSRRPASTNKAQDVGNRTTTAARLGTNIWVTQTGLADRTTVSRPERSSAASTTDNPAGETRRLAQQPRRRRRTTDRGHTMDMALHRLGPLPDFSGQTAREGPSRSGNASSSRDLGASAMQSVVKERPRAAPTCSGKSGRQHHRANHDRGLETSSDYVIRAVRALCTPRNRLAAGTTSLAKSTAELESPL